MASFSPTAEGFRVIFRRPAISLAEVAWRWSFAAAAWFLGATFLFEYAATLPVNALDRLLLGTQQPVLVGRAIHRIFEGSAFRFTKAGILLALALVIAWIILAALGRAVTVRSLIEELDFDKGERQTGTPIRSLLGLNLFRAALTLAAIAAAVGSLLLASSLWASTKASIGDITRLWFAVLLVTWIAWSGLNWLLSTSAIFVFVTSGERGAFEAITETVRFSVQRPGALAAPGLLFGLAHFGAFLFAGGAAVTVLGAAGAIGGRPFLFLELLIALAYGAVVDFLRIARLAAYLAVIRGPAETVSTEQAMTPPGTPYDRSEAVDPGELILSDMPLPAS
jgi:hypothetical protein